MEVGCKRLRGMLTKVLRSGVTAELDLNILQLCSVSERTLIIGYGRVRRHAMPLFGRHTSQKWKYYIRLGVG
jgi:hypothetical protein